ncbi:MAG: SulP family inorganic anion transporter [Burkholderiaceae bacterium]|nr:SulP family inorganic anion transporter [Burkholderiaceae bacterium]
MTATTLKKTWLPFLGWLPRVDRQVLRHDAMAALTGAIVVLPQAVAFASIAGLPAQYGLYAAMVPTVVAALWGSSWHLVTGPTTAISIVVFAAVSPLAEPGSADYVRLALTLTLLVGLMQLAMGLARLGALVNFISHTVIVGFTAGAAVLIAASQIGNFFGFSLPRGLHFHEIVRYAFEHFGEAHVWVALVGLVTLAGGLLTRRYLPRLPYMIVAMALGALTAALLDRWLGPGVSHIATVGTIAASLPPPSLPDLSFGAVKEMAFPALIVAVLALTEAVAIARAIAVQSGQRIDSNQEFVGQGLANIAGSFFSAYTASGSFNRSGLNYAAGARTPLAAILAAVFLLLIALIAAPWAAYLPVAAVAAVLFIVAWGLIDWREIRNVMRYPGERLVLALSFAGTLIDLEKGLFLGIVASLVLYLQRTSQPAIQERVPPREELGNPRRKFVDADTDHPGCPQLALLRVRGSLYFGAVEHVRERMQRVDAEEPRRRWLALLAQGVNFIDLSGVHLLQQEAQRRRALGGGLALVALPPPSQQVLRRAGLVGPDGVLLFAHKGEALRTLYPQLDSDVCRGCALRVFEECQRTLPDGSARMASR